MLPPLRRAPQTVRDTIRNCSMPRYSSPYASSFSFGPGPVSTALKSLIAVNVVAFLLQAVVPRLTFTLGLVPEAVFGQLQVWQLVTYMFLHGGLFHLLFNMLALWMFGGELERLWGTRFFLKYYFVTGVGAAALTVVVSLLGFQQLQHAVIIGASGAIYGLLLAYALYFPERRIYMYLVFPIQVKYFVMIMGALAFYSSMTESGGVANVTHLGGLLVGYLYLKGARLHPWSEVKYRYLKWRINRMRKKFDVYQGGRKEDWERRVH
jgi:membrane associated rhomboid family serine protease